jgi:plastocyanin
MRIVAAILLFFCLLLPSLVQAYDLTGTVQVVLKGDKPKTDLSSVIVYLTVDKDAAKIPQAILKKEYVMGMKDKQIRPRAIAVPVGALVTFPNYDPIFHNLFSVSTPNDFDVGLYKGGASKEKTFEYPGVVRIFCNVHPQMSATIVVTDTPYFTTTSKDGSFDLGDLPAGSFNLSAYAEEGQTSQKIEIKDAPLKVNMTINGRNFKKLPHKNKFGKDYVTDENEHY